MSVAENAETSSRVAMICPHASVGNATWPQALEFNLVSGAHRLVSGCHAAVTPGRTYEREDRRSQMAISVSNDVVAAWKRTDHLAPDDWWR